MRTTRVLALAAATAAFALPATASAAKPANNKHYLVGMASRSVALAANGTFGGGLVYLGGYGLGNGNVSNTGITYDTGRTANGNHEGGTYVRPSIITSSNQDGRVTDSDTLRTYVS